MNALNIQSLVFVVTDEYQLGNENLCINYLLLLREALPGNSNNKQLLFTCQGDQLGDCRDWQVLYHVWRSTGCFGYS